MTAIRHSLCLASFLAVVLLGACTSSVEPGVDFQETALPARANPFPNLVVSPEDAARIMRESRDTARSATSASKSTDGALKADVFFEEVQQVAFVKWKEMPPPPRIDEYNNSPRKEIAAYEVQKLFLDPEDYVVPPTVAQCANIGTYRNLFPGAEPSIPGTNCRLGVVALWLKDVRTPKNAEDLYDDDRFRTDPVYAYYLSNVNLLTYLVDHRDAKVDNFVIAKDDERRQVFSIDNGISFSPAIFNPFLPRWNKIRLPAIRKASVDRLRKIERGSLDTLRVLAQLELAADGMYRSVDPAAPEPSAPDRAVRIAKNKILLGLRNSEIDGLYKRIQQLIERVDSGKIAVF